jgi:hypothetical protein
MEVKMQTSFIPKKPIIESRNEGSGISLFLLLSIIVFIVAITLGGGIWVWQNSLNAEIIKDKIALQDAKKSYEENTINPLIRLNDRIEESKKLLDSHIAVSPVFAMLEKYTYKNIRYKTMKFSYAGKDKIRIDLTGVASTYDALSAQSDIFGGDSLKDVISEPVVSDFNPNFDGSISFNFTAVIDSSLISYESKISPVSTDETINDVTATSTNP